MKKQLVFIIISGLTFISYAYAQDSLDLNRKFIGTFHTSNVVYNGISFGFVSTMEDNRNVKTNGLRVEIPGIGLVSFMGNGMPNATEPFDLTNFKYSEVINGLNISTGSWCDCNYNGLTFGAVGQYGKLGNGFSLSGGWNIIDKQNGAQIAIIVNSSNYLKGIQISGFNFVNSGSGVQIGLLNKSKKFKGIQLGLWNVNQRRKSPIINWNFRD